MQTKSQQNIQERLNYFICNSYVDMEENIHTEFKGHDCLSMDNINPMEIDRTTLKTTKKAISRTINCFLNTLSGGSIYLGITDAGKVKGLEMSEDVREHFMVNLKDTLLRFDPPVENEDRIRVRFIPVLYLGPNDDPEQAYNSFNKGSKSESILNHVHLIRTYKPCWCLKNLRNQQNSNMAHPSYVIKLTITPFDMKAYIISQAEHTMNLKCIPLYRNEEGLSFIRGQASQRNLTLNEILQKTRQNAKLIAKAVLNDRKAQLKALKASDSLENDCEESVATITDSDESENVILKSITKKLNFTTTDTIEKESSSSSGVSLSSSPTSSPSIETSMFRVSPSEDSDDKQYCKSKSTLLLSFSGANDQLDKSNQRGIKKFPSASPSYGKYFAPRGKAPGSYSAKPTEVIYNSSFKPFGLIPGYDCVGVALSTTNSRVSPCIIEKQYSNANIEYSSGESNCSQRILNTPNKKECHQWTMTRRSEKFINTRRTTSPEEVNKVERRKSEPNSSNKIP